MALSVPLHFISPCELEEIFDKSELESAKIENRIKLLREWLQCENYLPKDIDETVLRNFLYGCKANLEKTKSKLEKYLIAKSKMTFFFDNRVVSPEENPNYPFYGCFYASRNQTATGNRVVVMRLPSQNTNGFDFVRGCKHMTMGLDFLLYEDKSVKYDYIYDAINFTGPMVAKINFTVAKNILEVIYNIMPFRTNSILVINTTPGFDIFMSIAKPLMPKKIKDRMRNVKVEELTNILPPECVPEDFGGTAEKLAERSKEIYQFFKDNPDWCRRTDKSKIVGPLPENKKGVYSFEQFCMDGSFRKLTID